MSKRNHTVRISFKVDNKLSNSCNLSRKLRKILFDM